MLDLLKIAGYDCFNSSNQNKIYGILTKVYNGNYSQKLGNFCLETIKKTYEENSLKELKHTLAFLRHLSKEEFKFMRDGFMLTRQNQSGLVTELLNFPVEGFSIVFSFLLNYQDTEQSESVLLSFTNTEENNKDFLKVFIKDKELYIFIKEEWRTGFKVEPFKLYLICITQEQPGFLKKNKSKV